MRIGGEEVKISRVDWSFLKFVHKRQEKDSGKTQEGERKNFFKWKVFENKYTLCLKKMRLGRCLQKEKKITGEEISEEWRTVLGASGSVRLGQKDGHIYCSAQASNIWLCHDYRPEFLRKQISEHLNRIS